MTVYIVPEKFSFGEATWLSKAGDTIDVTSGYHPVGVVKGGVTLRGGTWGMVVPWAAGSEDITFVDPIFDETKIRSVFAFQKLLPIELRLMPIGSEDGSPPFVTPEGCFLKFLGNLTTAGTPGVKLGPPGFPGDSFALQRPRALVQIEILSGLEIDFDLLLRQPPGSVGPTHPDRLSLDSAQRKEQRKIEAAISSLDEGAHEPHPPFMPFGDIMYLALWTLNRFLRAYAQVTGAPQPALRGLTFNEFKDGLRSYVINPRAPKQQIFSDQTFVDSYETSPLSQEKMTEVQEIMLSAPDYTLKHYVEYSLNRLEYHAAIVSMVQALEAGLDQFLKDKKPYTLTERGLFCDKKKVSIWEKCFDADPVKATSRLTNRQTQNLCELIEARNCIAHSGQCRVEAKFKTRERCATIEPLSEYRIYRHKKPWYWYYDGVTPLLNAIGQRLRHTNAHPSPSP